MDRSDPEPKQPLTSRLFFFVIGGLGSSVINTGILYLARNLLHAPDKVAYAISVVCTASIFFLWSYYVNFRTTVVWKNCLGRYLVCVVLTCVLNYVIGLTGIKKFAGDSLVLTYLVVVAVQSFSGAIKFLLYHFWVFPHAGEKAVGQPEPLVS